MKNLSARILPTKELKEKHSKGYTLAPMDICLKKGLIPESYYKAAYFFVSLYMLSYGKNVRIISSYDGFKNELVREKRSVIYTQEQLDEYSSLYFELVRLLKRIHAFDLICDVCIFNRFPSFLKTASVNYDREQIYEEYMHFKNALSELAKYLYSNNLLLA